jgi:mRNA interferase HicA
MKRRDFERHLHEQGCVLLREGSKHSVWLNQKNGLASTVPRHTNIDDPALVRKICKDLGISPPRKK